MTATRGGMDWRGPGHGVVALPEVFLPAMASLERRRRIAAATILLAPVVGLFLAAQTLDLFWLIVGIVVAVVVLIHEW